MLTIEIGVELVLEDGPRAKVDEFKIARPQIYEQIFVLDIAMDDGALVASDHGLDHLLEEMARHFFIQRPLLGDVIEQVLNLGKGEKQIIDQSIV